MIIDSLHHAERYFALHPLFRKAFACLPAYQPQAFQSGKTEVDAGIWAIASMGLAKTREEALEKFECHNTHIDIQYCVAGVETFGWKARNSCQLPKGNYLPEKDVQYFADQPDTFFQLQAGQFVIFFPGDVHAPLIGNGTIHKVVLKIEL